MAAPAPPSTHIGGVAVARKTPSLPSHRRLAAARTGRRWHPPRTGGGILMIASIEVENVSKEFDRHFQRTLKQVAVAKMRGDEIKRSFWALQDVSFTVEQGEAVGIMGLNGSGKSTLLKHIMGVMRPTSGQVRTRGRVSGLIATGAGFHPQMSGRENIYMNAAILGMTEQETDAKFDDIAGFADVGDAMDTPVG